MVEVWIYAKHVAMDFWMTVGEMAPYLLFGFLVAGLLSALVNQKLVEKHLGGRGIWPLIKASLFGIPLPLCSCGVIPVSMSLHKHGASKASSIAFLLSTPQTGVDSIFVTFSLLGPLMAVYRPLAALVTGLLGGSLVSFIHKDAEHMDVTPEKCSEACCGGESRKHKIVAGLKYGFVSLPQDIGKAMLAGIFVAALISAFVPEGFFAQYLGTGLLAMLVMMLVGIPVYVCASASVPVAAALILKGVTPGAALVFLMTGPATNAAALFTIYKVLGKKTALAYLVTVMICALGAGVLLDWMMAETALDVAIGTQKMLPAVVRYGSAVLLLVILAAATVTGKKHPN